jgi:hypothetical protein
LSCIAADTAKDVLLRWPDRVTEEAKTIRPDALITKLKQLSLLCNLGYGEVKLGGRDVSTKSRCQDLLRLGKKCH